MKGEIERLFDENPASYTDEQRRLFQRFKDALNAGEIRAAAAESCERDRMVA